MYLATAREAIETGLYDESEIDSTSTSQVNQNTLNDLEAKEEDEEEAKTKRTEQIELLKKAAEYLKYRLKTEDILDDELGDFQEVLNDGEENNEDTIEPLSIEGPSTSGDTAPHAELTVNGRTFDALSGYMEFSIGVIFVNKVWIFG